MGLPPAWVPSKQWQLSCIEDPLCAGTSSLSPCCPWHDVILLTPPTGEVREAQEGLSLSQITPLANLVQKPLLSDPQSGPSRLPYLCSVLPPSPGGCGPASRRSDDFTNASEPANIFSLSTPQFLKFKPHHMLWPRGLEEVVEVVPWVDCFPTINFARPSQPFLWLLSQEPVLLLSPANAPDAGE